MCGSIWYLTHVTSIQCLHNLHAVSSLSRLLYSGCSRLHFVVLCPELILHNEFCCLRHHFLSTWVSKRKKQQQKNTQTNKQTNKQTIKQTNKRKKAWLPGHFFKWLVGPKMGNNFVRPSQYWKGWPQVLYFISLGKANLWYGVASSEW